MDRTTVGRREFGRVTEGRGPVATGRVAEASPVLADGVNEFIFADVFSRSGLPQRERELLTVAVLCALGGCEPQLGVHVPAALDAGSDPDELIALCEQLSPYAGFPRALNALRAVRGVLEQRELPLPLPAERVRVGHHETLVTDTGGEDAAPLVLVHPLGLDRVVWRDVIRALPTDRRVLAIDLRGHGGAGGVPASDAPTAAADLVGVIDAAGLGDGIEVVAAGTGCAVGAALAEALGPRAARLTLVGPASVLPRAGDPETLLTWLRPRTLAGDGFMLRYLRDRVARSDPEMWAGLEEAPIAAGAAPVTVVIGSDDPLAGRSREIAAGLGAGVAVLADAGNLPAGDAPEALAALLAGVGR